MGFPITIVQGVAATTVQQALNPDGTPAIGVFAGTEPLYGAVWPGSAFESPSFTFSPTWNNGSQGLVAFPFTSAQTLGLWPGQYTCLARLADNSASLCSGSVVVLAAPVGQVVPAAQPFTRALADQGLLKRVGAAAARVSITLDAGSPISQFDDPFSRALAFMGLGPIDPISPSDADINLVTPAKWQELMDIAEAEFLVWMSGQLILILTQGIEEQTPDYRIRRDPFALQWLSKYGTDKMAKCLRVYGYGAGRVGGGTIDLGFQAKVCGGPTVLPADTSTLSWNFP
jgi:hypothetical protein